MSSHPELSSRTVIPLSSADGVMNDGSSPNTFSTHLPSDPERRGMSAGRGQWRGRWKESRRGGRQEAKAKAVGEKSQLDTPDTAKYPPRPRPTHFLCLPLYNHDRLRNRVLAFQTSLLGEQVHLGLSPSVEPNSHPPPSNDKGKGKPPAHISTEIEGLDTSIIIDPRRLHMTLGIVALEPEETSTAAAEGTGIVHQLPTVPYSSSTSPLSVTDASPCGPSPRQAVSRGAVAGSSRHTPTRPRKTVKSALNLLSSLKETISDILSGSDGVEVPLEVLDVFGTEPMRRPSTKPGAAGSMMISRIVDPNLAVADGNKEEEVGVGAGVLFLGLGQIQTENEERRKLERVCDLIHQTFKKEGYLTDMRPLTLHCTIINASHRKPKRRTPFSYSDILASPACQLLGADPEVPGNVPASNDVREPTSANVLVPPTSSATEKPKYRAPLKVPPPLSIALGTYRVREVQLWEMGSHGPNNQYVSCGGIDLK